MCRSLQILAVVVFTLTIVVAKPLKRGPPSPKPVEGDSPDDEESMGLSYERYLKEVVQVLESDPVFKNKLETANVSEIKSGDIAIHLALVNHTIRTKLDEIKRKEVSRLSDLHHRQKQEMSGFERGRPVPPSHLDYRNPHSFEHDDLKKLIKQTVEELENHEKLRKEEFKEYEMEKEFQKNEHLQELPEEERKKEEAKLELLKKQHRDHPKLNHPGSRDQMEEVWNTKDQLEDQQFDPKVFFMKHDLDSDGEWNLPEVEAILLPEIEKVFDEKNSPEEDDPIERQEELARMREHVFSEIDKDHSFTITLDEFMTYAGTHGENEEFKKDDGWKTLDESQVFTDEDYQNYLREHHAQPGEAQIPPSSHDLTFKPEVHEQQFQQGQMHGQQQQFQQQFQQPPHQQQQNQQQQQQQQQFQQPPQHQQQQFQQPPQQQQFQQPQHQQQQFQQPPQQQQFQRPPQHQQQQNQQQQQQQQFQQAQQQQQQPNVQKMSQDKKQLQDQLTELQEQLNKQKALEEQRKQQQQQQQQQLNQNQVPTS